MTTASVARLAEITNFLAWIFFYTIAYILIFYPHVWWLAMFPAMASGASWILKLMCWNELGSRAEKEEQ